MLQIEVMHYFSGGQTWQFSTEVLTILVWLFFFFSLGMFAACVWVCSWKVKTMLQFIVLRE